jgi:integrase-like protein
MKSTAVTEAFQAWSRRSGLKIPFQGAHCLRHSYALHLLHQGLPLKTIRDLLGHRSPESTAVYLRLVTYDLRVSGFTSQVPFNHSRRNDHHEDRDSFNSCLAGCRAFTISVSALPITPSSAGIAVVSRCNPSSCFCALGWATF